MQENTIKLTTVYGLLSLVLCLGICDALLLVRSRHQSARIAELTYENSVLSVAPLKGQRVPLIQGISLKDHMPLAVSLGSSERLTLLVFTQSCKFCEENWPAWEKILNGTKKPAPVFFLTPDERLDDDFVSRHPLLTKHSVLLGVAPEVLQAFNIRSTPQTIAIFDGKVQQTWVGVLHAKEIQEIRNNDILP